MTTAVLSNYLENKWIDHVLRNTTYTSPGTNVYVALYTSDPTDADTGSECKTPGTDSYSRQQVTAWDAPSGRATANTNAITWSAAGGTGWGTITHIGIRDASTSGNLLFYGQLTTERAIGAGDVFSINAGDLDISLGGAFKEYLAHALLSHTLRNSAYTSPGTSIYAALYTTTPTASTSGTEVTDANAYARNQITAWDAASNGATQNTNEEAWSAASGGTWGTVQGVAITDSGTHGGGNQLFFGALDANKTVNDGDTIKFAAGALDISVS